MEVITTDFENWGPYLMKQFQIMYEKGERCDLEISCRKQIFLVHRLLMSACSDYVRELNDKQHIILPEEVSCKALKTVIDFVYSGKIVFSKEEKDDLLLAANLLNMRLLTELIKMEESCSFTLSMDDECEDQSANGPVNNNVNAECGDSLRADQVTAVQVPSHGTKRKSESRSNRSRSPKNNVVLPPLHKFPYLQRKFSASRTYGLITNLTDPVPSRFEISDAELLQSAYRSTFEDVTYETDKLFKDSDCLSTLEDAHREFLKKLKDTTNNRRCYSNALYSPFDKYTPPYNINSEPTTNRRRESVVSFPTKVGSVVTAYGRKNKPSPPTPTQTVTSPKSVPASILASPFAKPNKVANNSSTTSNSNTTLPEKHVRFADIIDIHEVDMELGEPMSDFDALPKPVSPVPPELVQVPSIESGEKVELIKLNNAVPTCVDERTMSEEIPDVSISVIAAGTDDGQENAVENISTHVTDVKEEMGENDITMTDDSSKEPEEPVAAVQNVSDAYITPDLAPSQIKTATDTANSVSPHVSEISILPDQNDIGNVESECMVTPPAVAVPASVACTTTVSGNVDASVSMVSSVQSILTDSTVFTPLNTTNVSEIKTEPHSQIFALKVKGTENPAQLSKLVDLCKNNPLFKNKNVRFKIVPVKGPIPETLKEQRRSSAAALGINKAIIVRRTENAKPVSEEGKETAALENCVVRKKSKCGSIENVNGPWDCVACDEAGKPLTFATYFDYRTHLHSVHNEGNNPMYCVHCGYKSLKRNMQLYHLFTKHNVPPPTHIKFPKCDQCDFYALNEYYLQKHLVCHPSAGLEFVCSCKTAFKSSELLQKHMTSGDCKNSKSFTCGYCRCIFDRFVNLKAHMRVCMKERSKPSLQNNSLESINERTMKTISDGGKDYLAL